MRIAVNIDALDIDTRALIDRKGDIDLAGLGIGFQTRCDVDKGIAGTPGSIGQRIYRVFDLVAAEQLTILEGHSALQALFAQLVERGLYVDFTERILFPIVDRIGDVEIFAIRRQIGNR